MSAVNTNIQARQVQSALAQNTRHLDHTMAGLSTGKRINSASDDSAGSAISTKLATQARSLNMAVRNTNDGISMMQTADGAAGGIQDMLYRMKELAVQSINDTYSSDERTVLNSEFQHLESQIRDTVANTTWNSCGTTGHQFSVSLAHYSPHSPLIGRRGSRIKREKSTVAACDDRLPRRSWPQRKFRFETTQRDSALVPFAFAAIPFPA